MICWATAEWIEAGQLTWNVRGMVSGSGAGGLMSAEELENFVGYARSGEQSKFLDDAPRHLRSREQALQRYKEGRQSLLMSAARLPPTSSEADSDMPSA